MISVYNGGFEFAPPTNVAQTINGGNYIDGTSGGSATNGIFSWAVLTLSAGGAGAFLYDSANPHIGNYSLKVSTTAINAAVVATNAKSTSLADILANPGLIPILPSTAYTLSFWMKTVLNSGSAITGAQVIVSERSGSGGQSQATNSQGVLTTTSWTQYTMNFTSNAASQFLLVKLVVFAQDGSATLIMDAWFDDIVLVGPLSAQFGNYERYTAVGDGMSRSEVAN